MLVIGYYFSKTKTAYTPTLAQEKKKKNVSMWFNGILQVDGGHTLVERSHRLIAFIEQS